MSSLSIPAEWKFILRNAGAYPTLRIAVRCSIAAFLSAGVQGHAGAEKPRWLDYRDLGLRILEHTRRERRYVNRLKEFTHKSGLDCRYHGFSVASGPEFANAVPEDHGFGVASDAELVNPIPADQGFGVASGAEFVNAIPENHGFGVVSGAKLVNAIPEDCDFDVDPGSEFANAILADNGFKVGPGPNLCVSFS